MAKKDDYEGPVLSVDEAEAQAAEINEGVEVADIKDVVDESEIDEAIKATTKKGRSSDKKAPKKTKKEEAPDVANDPLAALAAVSSDLGNLGKIMVEDVAESWIDTGHIGLNYLVSGRWLDGGFPRGKIGEFFGPSASAKSTLGYIVGSNVQKIGGLFAVIDAEGAYNMEFLRMLGVDPRSAIRLIPRDKNGDEFYAVEAVFQTAKDFIQLMRKKGFLGPIYILLDSIAACPLAEEWYAMKEGQKIPEDQGRKAKLVGQWQRIIAGYLSAGDNTLHIINQLRIDRKTGGEITTSGRATEYYSSTRINIRRKKIIARTTFKNKPGEGTDDDWKKRQLGGFFSVQCEKSRQTSPGRRLRHMELYYKHGIAPMSSLFDLLETEEFFMSHGSRYILTDPASRDSAILRPMEGAKSFYRKDVEEGDWLFENAQAVFGCTGDDLAKYVSRWEAADRFSQNLKLTSGNSKKELEVIDDETGDDSDDGRKRQVDVLPGGWRSKIAKSTVIDNETE
jgi:RecA/RadA recombinase